MVEILRNSYLVVPIVLLITIFFTFIDSKITGKSVEKNQYIKNGLFVAFVSFLIVNLNIKGESSIETIMKGPAPF